MNQKIWLCAIVVFVLGIPAHASIINGGFESGFTGWTRADQLGSEGTFSLQTGALSPVNSFPVPAPPEGTTAAMTDAMGPGSHVLYQDFVVPTVVATASVSFSVFIQNQHTEFIEAGTLDFVPAQNQHARVDIMTIPADPFAPGADLMNLFLTSPGDPLVSGYNPVVVNITAFLQAHQGETLRLRFAEVDNVNFFNMGVDDVRLTAIIPEPSSWVLMLGGLIGVAGLQRRSTAR